MTKKILFFFCMLSYSAISQRDTLANNEMNIVVRNAISGEMIEKYSILITTETDTNLINVNSTSSIRFFLDSNKYYTVLLFKKDFEPAVITWKNESRNYGVHLSFFLIPLDISRKEFRIARSRFNDLISQNNGDKCGGFKVVKQPRGMFCDAIVWISYFDESTYSSYSFHRGF